ncbi:MAG: guanylate kinase [Bradymonadia bacterium]
MLILAAVSGTGKSTIARRLLERHDTLSVSVSHTTRHPRQGEIDGVHYHFVDRSSFDEMVAGGGFAEWAEYVGNAYGTANETINHADAAGLDLIFDIEIQGARQIKEQYPDAVSIFLLPPDWDEVRRRLTVRGTDAAEVVERRLQRGRTEIVAASEFDYVVVNRDLDIALDEVSAIYQAARLRNRGAHPTLVELLGVD